LRGRALGVSSRAAIVSATVVLYSYCIGEVKVKPS
jgi:hypothetical protein